MDPSSHQSSPNSLQSTPSKRFYIPSLDGIRAVSFLLVFFSHAGYGHIIPGGFGVSIFFFLSGYLITTIMRREYSKSQSISLKKFYWKRVTRILPSFYFTLLLGTALTLLGILKGNIQLGPWLGQAFHMLNYYLFLFGGDDGIAPGSNVFWSLAVEWHFYMVFPLLYRSLCKKGISRGNQSIVFLSICLGVLLWRCFLVFQLGASSEYITYMTDTRLDAILFGCVLAVSGNPVLDPQADDSEKVLKYWLLPLSAAILILSLVLRSNEFRETLRYTVQAIALYPWFIACIRFPHWPIFQVLNLKWIRFLGVLSYPMYLVHYSVVLAIQDAWPSLNVASQAGVALIISFAMAWAIYHLIEVPMIKFCKQSSFSLRLMGISTAISIQKS